MEDKMEKTTPTTLLAQLHKFILKHQHRVLTGIPFLFFLAQFGRFTPILFVDCLSSPFFTSYFFVCFKLIKRK